MIQQWRRRRSDREIAKISRPEIEGWAKELIDLHLTNSICTPVRLEFLCNTGGRQELDRARWYLGRFRAVDAGEITQADWVKAERFAPKRKGDVKHARQLGDCLIAAIYSRFGYALAPSPNLDLDLFRRLSSSD